MNIPAIQSAYVLAPVAYIYRAWGAGNMWQATIYPSMALSSGTAHVMHETEPVNGKRAIRVLCASLGATVVNA